MFLGVQEMRYQAILTNFTQHVKNGAYPRLHAAVHYLCLLRTIPSHPDRFQISPDESPTMDRADAGLQNMTVNVDNPSTVRAFGLHQSVSESSSHSIQMVYAHHFVSHTTAVSTELTIPQPTTTTGLRRDEPCHVEWLDPETGSTAPGTATRLSRRDGSATYSSPHFQVDVALVVIC